ncbi:PilN domain-containing protein [Endosaccharibacter trunci]
MLYPAARMIRDALVWWSDQMLDLVPARFTRPDPSEAGALLVEPQLDAVRLSLREAGTERVIEIPALRRADPVLAGTEGDPAQIEPADADGFVRVVNAVLGPKRAMPVLLRLPADAVLRRDVVLPLAAEAGLDRVLAFEMDRLTPFSAEELFFSSTITGRDRATGRLFVRLALLPRAPLRPVLSLLAAAGTEAQAIEVPASGGEPALRIPLAHEAPVSARRQRLSLRAGFGACAALLLLAIVLPFVQQQWALNQADRRIAALRTPVQAVQALQNRIDSGAAGALLVRAERARLGDTLSVLAAVTTVLPDDSYLTDLALRQGELTISGQSPSAARLIPAISAVSAFTAPAFTAPVTRIEGQGQELFSIKAGIAPGDVPQSAPQSAPGNASGAAR